MLINVSGLSEMDVRTVSLVGYVTMPDNYHLCEKETLVKFEGSVKKEKNRYLLKGLVTAAVSFNCDRCLSPVSKTVKAEVNEIFSADLNEVSNADGEMWPVNANTLELTDCLLANIAANMPMGVVCMDDCKGLCVYCGRNLNEGLCNCEMPVDPRFEILNSLRTDIKEV
ncbi:MAG: DUF177 domain-containing protein [Clostridiales bacterium]|nr:DUF177 domain-containing protein [Clostridiales bacterium]